MKTRSGFVSNSSSSSFVIQTDNLDAIIKTMMELKEKNISFNVNIPDNIECQRILTENHLEYDCEGSGNVELLDSDTIREIIDEDESGQYSERISEEGIAFLKKKLEAFELKNE